jgi:serine/threonine protein kinase
MSTFLAVIAGPDKGHVFPLSNEFNILLGRSRHTITRLSDLSVSRVHCEIEMKGKRIIITDQDSGGGTFVNGKRITECDLRIGDIVKIGDTQLRVEGPPDKEDVHSAKTLSPSVQPPPRPVLLTANRLHELTGVKLNHYEIGPVVAKGHSGLVFKANDFKNDREVAFKVMWPEFTTNEEEIQRFIRAMKTMLPMRHPNLISLYGAGKTGPHCWVAMEFVEGESLSQVISRLGTAGMLDWKKTLRIAVYVSRALEFAHGKSIVHRNITPQNILIGKTPDITKLGDLMLAKAIEGSLAQQITKPGQMLGDIRFMSPEQTGSSPSIDGRSDIFSLGALLYQLLAGRPPFEGNSLVETVTKIRQAQPVEPKKYQLAVPDAFQGIVLKMLAKRPDDRYANATELIKKLEMIAKNHAVSL